jgi:acyl carrier protein
MINEEKFITQFKEQFLDPEEVVFERNTKFRDLKDWDSLTGMSILVMIEDEYKVTISPEELKAANTINDVIELVNVKVNA